MNRKGIILTTTAVVLIVTAIAAVTTTTYFLSATETGNQITDSLLGSSLGEKGFSFIDAINDALSRVGAGASALMKKRIKIPDTPGCVNDRQLTQGVSVTDKYPAAIVVDRINNINLVWIARVEWEGMLQYVPYFTRIDNRYHPGDTINAMQKLPVSADFAPNLIIDSENNIIFLASSEASGISYVKMSTNYTVDEPTLSIIKNTNLIAAHPSPDTVRKVADAAKDTDDNIHIVLVEENEELETMEFRYYQADPEGNLQSKSGTRIAANKDPLYTSYPQIEVDKHKKAHIVWYEKQRAGTEEHFKYARVGQNGRLEIAQKDANQNLPRTGPIFTRHFSMEIDSKNDLHLVWHDDGLTPYVSEVFYTKLDSFGNVQLNNPMMISADDGINSMYPQISVSAKDLSKQIIWDDYKDSIGIEFRKIYFMKIDKNGHQASPAMALSNGKPMGPRTPTITAATDKHGRLHVLWTETDNTLFYERACTATDPPVIEILSPGEIAVTMDPKSVVIVGKVTDNTAISRLEISRPCYRGMTLTQCAERVYLSANDSFAYPLPTLVGGVNDVTIAAQDTDGNIASKVVQVSYARTVKPGDKIFIGEYIDFSEMFGMPLTEEIELTSTDGGSVMKGQAFAFNTANATLVLGQTERLYYLFPDKTKTVRLVKPIVEAFIFLQDEVDGRKEPGKEITGQEFDGMPIPLNQIYPGNENDTHPRNYLTFRAKTNLDKRIFPEGKLRFAFGTPGGDLDTYEVGLDYENVVDGTTNEILFDQPRWDKISAPPNCKLNRNVPCVYEYMMFVETVPGTLRGITGVRSGAFNVELSPFTYITFKLMINSTYNGPCESNLPCIHMGEPVDVKGMGADPLTEYNTVMEPIPTPIKVYADYETLDYPAYFAADSNFTSSWHGYNPLGACAPENITFEYDRAFPIEGIQLFSPTFNNAPGKLIIYKNTSTGWVKLADSSGNVTNPKYQQHFFQAEFADKIRIQINSTSESGVSVYDVAPRGGEVNDPLNYLDGFTIAGGYFDDPFPDATSLGWKTDTFEFPEWYEGETLILSVQAFDNSQYLSGWQWFVDGLEYHTNNNPGFSGYMPNSNGYEGEEAWACEERAVYGEGDDAEESCILFNVTATFPNMELGEHTISFVAFDNWYPPKNITLNLFPISVVPRVAITSPSDTYILDTFESINFVGEAYDLENGIAAAGWYLDGLETRHRIVANITDPQTTFTLGGIQEFLGSDYGEQILNPLDYDGDGILDDGDNSGVTTDNKCTNGDTTDCDDNCIAVPNKQQVDADADGNGDLCGDTLSVNGGFTRKDKYCPYPGVALGKYDTVSYTAPAGVNWDLSGATVSITLSDTLALPPNHMYYPFFDVKLSNEAGKSLYCKSTAVYAFTDDVNSLTRSFSTNDMRWCGGFVASKSFKEIHQVDVTVTDLIYTRGTNTCPDIPNNLGLKLERIEFTRPQTPQKAFAAVLNNSMAQEIDALLMNVFDDDPESSWVPDLRASTPTLFYMNFDREYKVSKMSFYSPAYSPPENPFDLRLGDFILKAKGPSGYRAVSNLEYDFNIDVPGEAHVEFSSPLVASELALYIYSSQEQQNSGLLSDSSSNMVKTRDFEDDYVYQTVVFEDTLGGSYPPTPEFTISYIGAAGGGTEFEGVCVPKTSPMFYLSNYSSTPFWQPVLAELVHSQNPIGFDDSLEAGTGGVFYYPDDAGKTLVNKREYRIPVTVDPGDFYSGDTVSAIIVSPKKCGTNYPAIFSDYINISIDGMPEAYKKPDQAWAFTGTFMPELEDIREMTDEKIDETPLTDFTPAAYWSGSPNSPNITEIKLTLDDPTRIVPGIPHIVSFMITDSNNRKYAASRVLNAPQAYLVVNVTNPTEVPDISLEVADDYFIVQGGTDQTVNVSAYYIKDTGAVILGANWSFEGEVVAEFSDINADVFSSNLTIPYTLLEPKTPSLSINVTAMKDPYADYIKFDGDDYLAVDDTDEFDINGPTPERSISAVIKPTRDAPTGTIASKGSFTLGLDQDSVPFVSISDAAVIGRGPEHDELFYPKDVAVYPKSGGLYPDHLYIADSGNYRIAVLDGATGDYEFSFTAPDLIPYRVEVTNDGYVYVLDERGKKLVQFDNDGELLYIWDISAPLWGIFRGVDMTYDGENDRILLLGDLKRPNGDENSAVFQIGISDSYMAQVALVAWDWDNDDYTTYHPPTMEQIAFAKGRIYIYNNTPGMFDQLLTFKESYNLVQQTGGMVGRYPITEVDSYSTAQDLEVFRIRNWDPGTNTPYYTCHIFITYPYEVYTAFPGCNDGLWDDFGYAYSRHPYKLYGGGISIFNMSRPSVPTGCAQYLSGEPESPYIDANAEFYRMYIAEYRTNASVGAIENHINENDICLALPIPTLEENVVQHGASWDFPINSKDKPLSNPSKIELSDWDSRPDAGWKQDSSVFVLNRMPNSIDNYLQTGELLWSYRVGAYGSDPLRTVKGIAHHPPNGYGIESEYSSMYFADSSANKVYWAQFSGDYNYVPSGSPFPSPFLANSWETFYGITDDGDCVDSLGHGGEVDVRFRNVVDIATDLDKNLYILQNDNSQNRLIKCGRDGANSWVIQFFSGDYILPNSIDFDTIDDSSHPIMYITVADLYLADGYDSQGVVFKIKQDEDLEGMHYGIELGEDCEQSTCFVKFAPDHISNPFAVSVTGPEGKEGYVYVADVPSYTIQNLITYGYIFNGTKILKFTKEGDYVGEFGDWGWINAVEGPFTNLDYNRSYSNIAIPIDLAVSRDMDSKRGHRALVLDNLNRRVSVFDVDPLIAKSSSKIKELGRSYRLTATIGADKTTGLRPTVNNSIKLYIDGIEDATASHTTSLSPFGPNPFDLDIGTFNGYGSLENVVIDSLAIYNKELSTAEVEALPTEDDPGGSLVSKWELKGADPTNDLEGGHDATAHVQERPLGRLGWRVRGPPHTFWAGMELTDGATWELSRIGSWYGVLFSDEDTGTHMQMQRDYDALLSIGLGGTFKVSAILLKSTPNAELSGIYTISVKNSVGNWIDRPFELVETSGQEGESKQHYLKLIDQIDTDHLRLKMGQRYDYNLLSELSVITSSGSQHPLSFKVGDSKNRIAERTIILAANKPALAKIQNPGLVEWYYEGDSFLAAYAEAAYDPERILSYKWALADWAGAASPPGANGCTAENSFPDTPIELGIKETRWYVPSPCLTASDKADIPNNVKIGVTGENQLKKTILMDGVNDTIWTGSVANNNQYQLDIDLGVILEIGAIKLVHTNIEGDQFESFLSNTISVEASKTGSEGSFTSTPLSGRVYSSACIQDENCDTNITFSSQTEARYIRIFFTSKASSYPRIGEVIFSSFTDFDKASAAPEYSVTEPLSEGDLATISFKNALGTSAGDVEMSADLGVGDSALYFDGESRDTILPWVPGVANITLPLAAGTKYKTGQDALYFYSRTQTGYNLVSVTLDFASGAHVTMQCDVAGSYCGVASVKWGANLVWFQFSFENATALEQYDDVGLDSITLSVIGAESADLQLYIDGLRLGTKDEYTFFQYEQNTIPKGKHLLNFTITNNFGIETSDQIDLVMYNAELMYGPRTMLSADFSQIFLAIPPPALSGAFCGASGPASACGDGICNYPAEDADSCLPDCDVVITCGDGICLLPFETPLNCPTDCALPGICGDGICNPQFETGETCSDDCVPFNPAQPCGDGICDETESEDYLNCPDDCVPIGDPSCGDGICMPPEIGICMADCPVSPLCPDGLCDYNTEYGICLQDCPDPIPACSNGVCHYTSDYSCPPLDHDCPMPCGDGVCMPPAEDSGNCPEDCVFPPVCSDQPIGVCSFPEEYFSTCPADCPDVLSTCGDNICLYPDENPTDCPADCTPQCGDGLCLSPYETPATCAADCPAGTCSGQCPEDPFMSCVTPAAIFTPPTSLEIVGYDNQAGMLAVIVDFHLLGAAFSQHPFVDVDIILTPFGDLEINSGEPIRAHIIREMPLPGWVEFPMGSIGDPYTPDLLTGLIFPPTEQVGDGIKIDIYSNDDPEVATPKPLIDYTLSFGANMMFLLEVPVTIGTCNSDCVLEVFASMELITDISPEGAAEPIMCEEMRQRGEVAPCHPVCDPCPPVGPCPFEILCCQVCDWYGPDSAMPVAYTLLGIDLSKITGFFLFGTPEIAQSCPKISEFEVLMPYYKRPPWQFTADTKGDFFYQVLPPTDAPATQTSTIPSSRGASELRVEGTYLLTIEEQGCTGNCTRANDRIHMEPQLGLTATPISNDTIFLSWNAVQNYITDYWIFSDTNGEPGYATLDFNDATSVNKTFLLPQGLTDEDTFTLWVYGLDITGGSCTLEAYAEKTGGSLEEFEDSPITLASGSGWSKFTLNSDSAGTPFLRETDKTGYYSFIFGCASGSGSIPTSSVGGEERPIIILELGSPGIDGAMGFNITEGETRINLTNDDVGHAEIRQKFSPKYCDNKDEPFAFGTHTTIDIPYLRTGCVYRNLTDSTRYIFNITNALYSDIASTVTYPTVGTPENIWVQNSNYTRGSIALPGYLTVKWDWASGVKEYRLVRKVTNEAGADMPPSFGLPFPSVAGTLNEYFDVGAAHMIGQKLCYNVTAVRADYFSTETGQSKTVCEYAKKETEPPVIEIHSPAGGTAFFNPTHDIIINATLRDQGGGALMNSSGTITYNRLVSGGEQSKTLQFRTNDTLIRLGDSLNRIERNLTTNFTDFPPLGEVTLDFWITDDSYNEVQESLVINYIPLDKLKINDSTPEDLDPVTGTKVLKGKDIALKLVPATLMDEVLISCEGAEKLTLFSVKPDDNNPVVDILDCLKPGLNSIKLHFTKKVPSAETPVLTADLEVPAYYLPFKITNEADIAADKEVVGEMTDLTDTELSGRTIKVISNGQEIGSALLNDSHFDGQSQIPFKIPVALFPIENNLTISLSNAFGSAAEYEIKGIKNTAYDPFNCSYDNANRQVTVTVNDTSYLTVIEAVKIYAVALDRTSMDLLMQIKLSEVGSVTRQLPTAPLGGRDINATAVNSMGVVVREKKCGDS